MRTPDAIRSEMGRAWDAGDDPAVVRLTGELWDAEAAAGEVTRSSEHYLRAEFRATQAE